MLYIYIHIICFKKMCSCYRDLPSIGPYPSPWSPHNPKQTKAERRVIGLNSTAPVIFVGISTSYQRQILRMPQKVSWCNATKSLLLSILDSFSISFPCFSSLLLGVGNFPIHPDFLQKTTLQKSEKTLVTSHHPILVYLPTRGTR